MRKSLGEEWMLRILENLGLKHLDAKVYVYLLQREPMDLKTIARAFEAYKLQFYRSLKALRLQGIVIASQDRPTRFFALSFEKVLDLLVETNREEANRIAENKEKILEIWRSEILGNSQN
jgi:sugar-specific transcriptional regulator TrmB